MRRSLLILLLLAGTPVLAQPRLTLTIDRTIVAIGESVNLILTLTGNTSADDVQLPPMQNLQVVAGPYRSTSYEIINGRASSSVSWTYRLRATKVGQEQIGPIQVVVDRKPVTSDQLTVNIVSSPTKGTAQSGRDPESPDVFIRVVPDKTEVYKGEQITLTYKIYFSTQISQPEIVKLPAATGFWVEELTVPQKQPLTDELVNGKAYKVGILRKVALFPTSTGQLTVEPMTIATKVQKDARRRSRDPFDIFNDPFFSLGPQVEQVEVVSPAVTVRIKPLPSADVPEGFAGAVGTYKVRAYLDKPMSRTDEAVTLTVQIEGTGNIKTLPEPLIVFPPDVEHYDPKALEQIRRDQQRISGMKRFNYVVIPRAPGQQVIPAIAYAFFDPSSNKYLSVSTEPLTLSVERGTGVAGGTGFPMATKRGVESIATDIAFIKTRSDAFKPRGMVPHKSMTFWIWTTGPWAALAGLVVVIRRREAAVSPRRNLSKAMKLAKAELGQAEKDLMTENMDSTSRHISTSLNHIAAALMGERSVDLFDPELPMRWTTLGYDPELLERIVKIERECDVIRFSPSSADKLATRELFEKASDVIEDAARMRTRVTAR